MRRQHGLPCEHRNRDTAPGRCGYRPVAVSGKELGSHQTHATAALPLDARQLMDPVGRFAQLNVHQHFDVEARADREDRNRRSAPRRSTSRRAGLMQGHADSGTKPSHGVQRRPHTRAPGPAEQPFKDLDGRLLRTHRSEQTSTTRRSRGTARRPRRRRRSSSPALASIAASWDGRVTGRRTHYISTVRHPAPGTRHPSAVAYLAGPPPATYAITL